MPSEERAKVAVSTFKQLSAGGYFGKSQVSAVEATRAVCRDCVGGGRQGGGT